MLVNFPGRHGNRHPNGVLPVCQFPASCTIPIVNIVLNSFGVIFIVVFSQGAPREA